MMALGIHVFGMSLTNFQSLKNNLAIRWPANKPVGAAPIYQFLGRDDQQVTLSGLIFPEWVAGYQGLAALREAAAAGGVHSLASALGDVFGNWIISGVESDESAFNRSGTPRKVEFSLSLYRAQSRFAGGLF